MNTDFLSKLRKYFCIFPRANLAAACGGIIYFVLYIPYNMAYAFEDEMTQSQKILAVSYIGDQLFCVLIKNVFFVLRVYLVCVLVI